MIDKIFLLNDGNAYNSLNYGVIFYKNGDKIEPKFYSEYDFKKLTNSIRFKFMNYKIPVTNMSIDDFKEEYYFQYDSLINFISHDDTKLSESMHKKYGFDNLFSLSSLYWLSPNKTKEQDRLFEQVALGKKLAMDYCNKHGISYRTNSNEIIGDMLEKVANHEAEFYTKHGFTTFSKIDFSYCLSKDTILENFKNGLNLSNEDDLDQASKKYDDAKRNIISTYFSSFIGEFDNFLVNISRKDNVMSDEYYRNWAEFFTVIPNMLEIFNTLEYCSKEFDNERDRVKLDRLEGNKEFMEDLDTFLEHDSSKEIYRFHAATSKKSAEDIISKGFFVLGDNLDMTTIPELTKKQVENYGYGNGYKFYEDYIIVVREPLEQNILRETTPEEKENSKGISRRIGTIGMGADYIVDPENIVGYIDKKDCKVIFNPQFKKNIVNAIK